MPFYDYFCEANGQTVEAFHSSGKTLATWGEACKSAKVDPGNTPLDSPVTRVISGVTPTIFKTKGLDKDDYGDRLRI